MQIFNRGQMRRAAVKLCVLFAAIMLPGTAFGQSSASPFTSAARYDVERHLVGVIKSSSNQAGGPFIAQRLSYDAVGHLVKEEFGYLANWQDTAVRPIDWPGFVVDHIKVYTYGAAGDKISEAIENSAGQIVEITQSSYDAYHRPVCTTQRMNSAIFSSLPSDPCVLGAEGSAGPDRITRNIYDQAGDLIQVRKAVGTPLEQAYSTFSYTPNGNQEYVLDANGNRAKLEYDGFDREARWTFPSAAAPTAYNPSTQLAALATAGALNTSDYEAYTYDANGNRTSLRKRDGRTIGFGYDSLNRVTSKTYPNGGARSVFYSYDLRGLQTAARYDSASGADAVTSGYDGFGELTSSTTSMSGASRALQYGYDANGSRTWLKYPDNQVVNYYRDGINRLYYADLNGNTPLFYPNYDAVGRPSALLRLEQGGWAWSFGTWYGYDGISRISSIANGVVNSTYNLTETFTHNPVGQIATRTRDNAFYAFAGYLSVNRSYATNGLNQYKTAGPANFAYDANGNLTSDGTNSYTYDIENRLITASNGAALAYDPLGRLWQTSGTSTGTTRFLYDGDALLVEYDASGVMLKRYVHSDGADDPLVEYSGTGTASPLYLFADHQGSITIGADKNGQAIRFNRYDEYGIPSFDNAGRFQYTGQAWLPEIGMYYYKARIYSPTLGRFLQTDPIGYKDQNNLYTYVGNDPVNHTDPTGTDAVDWVHGVLTAASFCPSVCGSLAAGADGIVYAAQGDGASAGISFAAAAIGTVSDAGAAKVLGTLAKEGVALARTERAGAAAVTGSEKILYRRGAYDTTKALRTQSAAAEKQMGVHGVSVSTSPAAKPGQVVRCTTCSQVEAAGFKVEKTGADPNHYTVIMPKVITNEVSQLWNSLFK